MKTDPGEYFSSYRKILIPYDRREAMSLREAAKFAGRSESTMRNWCEDHGIGRRVGGVWGVSRIALAIFLDGDDYGLKLYHDGENDSDYLAHYYERFGLPRPR
jgi:hypothetical protein